MNTARHEGLEHLKLLDVEDLIALNIGSRATIYRMLQRGDIPCVRRGRSVRVRVIDLEAWLEKGGSTSNVLPFRQRRSTKKSA